jgi:hypothetical protein
MSEQLSSGKFTNFVIFFLEKNEKNKLTLWQSNLAMENHPSIVR